jgi:group I intron endonuclease
VRLLQHINGSTNTHLKHALTLYSLEAFEFLVVEFVTNTVLLTAREQEYLDWLFSLSEDLRYNFCSTANSTLGYTHTAESKALISEYQSGENNSFFDHTHMAEAKAAISAAIKVALMGNTNAFSKSVFAYDQNHKLVGEFPSQLKAAKYLKVDTKTL